MTENPFTPIYRACNTGSNADKYEFLKNGGIKTPRYIDLELTNKCNFSCRFCPTGTNSVRRDKGFMSDEVVEALVQSVQKYNIAGVRFSRWGEPTFHPQWLDIIEKFKKTGAMVHLNTNGSLITESDIKRMIDMEFDSIKFSFQGTDGETYNQMRKGGDYDKLLAKLKLLHSLREAQGQKNASNELLGGGG